MARTIGPVQEVIGGGHGFVVYSDEGKLAMLVAYPTLREAEAAAMEMRVLLGAACCVVTPHRPSTPLCHGEYGPRL
jgi:hypothetical protein